MNWPNSTNRGTALLRFIHQAEPKPLLRDDFVGWFVEQSHSPSAAQLLQSLDNPIDAAAAFQRIAYRYTVLREKFFDDLIDHAVPSGLRQLLLLGAGFDTRALRLPSLTNPPVRVVEVDTPATIETKLKMLTRHLGVLPPTLQLVAIDFTTDSLQTILHHGLHSTDPTICIWQGVSYYLPETVVISVLDFVKHDLSPGSLFGFDCCTPLMLKDNDTIPGIRFNIDRLNTIGEPYRFAMYPAQMRQLLTDRGFSHIVTLDQTDLEKKYLGTATLPDDMWYAVTART